ncbi:UDP-glucose 4,6-dehydratase/UDP-4-keto-6-deoxy-D-glucose [Pseudocercospora fuligena]|uniref:UDP-glucose 4,6-dehydratase/UDP-4-keto-6-deoxy-D-glucose n=1 Tax=Pseudocercospora fuligena TaxID=685502 RepID=A0A8H6R4T4_9PEZI|nr:UDP-glucose 4,6-dehydratase/UDP-4-keto-6-deoxy-D-glucose [Pseudocercospora fuligena]
MLSALRSTLQESATPSLTYQRRPHIMPAAKQNKFLVWGSGGWIGGQIIDLLKEQGKIVLGTTVRMEEQQKVREVLDTIKPTHVINCAGKTGRPNVDWCEDHKIETMQANGLGALILTNECYTRGIHLTHLATGCANLHRLLQLKQY